MIVALAFVGSIRSTAKNAKTTEKKQPDFCTLLTESKMQRSILNRGCKTGLVETVLKLCAALIGCRLPDRATSLMVLF
jgi:hypothetical protein